MEWREGEEASTNIGSTLAANIRFRQFVGIALRWRIERDYHELKQEVGLGHFDGRSWRGFHHHALVHCRLRIPALRARDDSLSATASTKLF